MSKYPSPVTLVVGFHTTYGQAIRTNPVLNLSADEIALYSNEAGEYVWPGPLFDVPEKALRHDLIDEEVEELTYALLGPNGDGTVDSNEVVKKGKQPWSGPDFVETLDALADIVYVVCGAALTHGVTLRLDNIFSPLFYGPVVDAEFSIASADDFRLAKSIANRFKDLNAAQHVAQSTDELRLVWESLIEECYVLAGSLGVNLDEILEEVQASNMSKLGRDEFGKNTVVLRNESGKVIKGEDFFEPNIPAIIERVRERGFVSA